MLEPRKQKGAPLLLSALLMACGGHVQAAGKAAAAAANHMSQTVQATQQALDAAQARDQSACLANIKLAKQGYKEVSGDFADRPVEEDTIGKPLEDAIKKLKEGQKACESGDTAGAVAILGQALSAMKSISASLGK
jgi:hypothetical protein